MTDDKILANGFFANVVPELDPDTKRMYQLLVNSLTVVPRNERLFVIVVFIGGALRPDAADPGRQELAEP